MERLSVGRIGSSRRQPTRKNSTVHTSTDHETFRGRALAPSDLQRSGAFVVVSVLASPVGNVADIAAQNGALSESE